MISTEMSEPDNSSVPSQPALTITDRELSDRLEWFTKVRWALGGFCLLMLMISWHLVGVRFRYGAGPPTVAPAVGVVLVMFLYNAVFLFLVRVVRGRGPVRRRLIVVLALLQISCDMIAISALIQCTGGVGNFFLILILVPLVIAPTLLPQSLAYLMAVVAAGLINGLAWGQQTGLLPHMQVLLAGAEPTVHGAGVYRDPIYVLQVTTAMTATSFAVVFVASSITKRLRRREAELEQAYRLCRLADETKSFFMRKAGHEMRAPLAAIYSILEAIAEPANGLDAERVRLVQRAGHRTRALMGLVSDLSRYSRLRSAEGILQIKELSFGDVVRHTLELFRQQAAKGNLQLAGDIQPVPVRGDEELLRELVTNLIANAIQYTPAGGRIDVALARRNEQAVLTVADTGIGISDDGLANLFEEFYRAPQAKRVFPDGTGLGLSICRRIVEMHGGKITADRRQPAGSIFTVRIPVAGA